MSQDAKFLTLNRDLNPNAQFSVGNFAAFADAAGTSPVDGTGGSPTVTIARTLATPLDGVASFLFTKDAANRQGEGFSSDVILQPSDATKVMRWSFDYQVTTGTYTGFQTPPLFSDLTLWVYDVTNSVMYQVAPYQLDGSVSTTNQYSMNAQWQVPVGCLQARLIWFLGNTSASAFTARFNNIQFGRLSLVFGAAVSPWQSVTVTGAWVANTTYTAMRRRVGDNYEYNIHLAISGTPTTSALNINLPSGDVIDTTKFPVTPVLGGTILGRGEGTGNGNQYDLVVYYRTTTIVTVDVQKTVNAANPTFIESSTSVTQAVPFAWTTGNTIDVMFSVPIVGLTANATLGIDADSRIIAARVGGDPASASSGNPVIFPTVAYDTAGTYNATTGRYTAPVSGYYRVHGFITSANTGVQVNAYVDAASVIIVGQTDSNGECSYTGTVLVTAGQIIDLRPNNTLDAATGSTIHFERLSGPAQVQAPDTPTSSYNTNAGQSIANAATPIIDFEDKIWDTFSSVTIGASWKFTATRVGKLQVDAAVSYASAVFTAGTNIQLFVYKNGALYKKIAEVLVQAAVSITDIIALGGGCMVDVNSGDTVDIRTAHGESTARSLTTVSTDNYCDISYKDGF